MKWERNKLTEFIIPFAAAGSMNSYKLVKKKILANTKASSLSNTFHNEQCYCPNCLVALLHGTFTKQRKTGLLSLSLIIDQLVLIKWKSANFG